MILRSAGWLGGGITLNPQIPDVCPAVFDDLTARRHTIAAKYINSIYTQVLFVPVE